MAVTTDYVNALGAGSGLDTKSIVNAMVEAEKASKQSTIDRRTVDVDTKISGMAQVKSALANLQTAFAKLDDKDEFNFSALSNSDPTTVYSQLDGSTPLEGSFAVTVSQLAQGEIRQSNAQGSPTNDLNSATEYSFSIATGTGGSQVISLDAGAVSLDNAASAINDLGMGYTAWVVETSADNYQLLLQGPAGASNTITITDTADLFGLNTAGNTMQQAQNAEATMNGVSISRTSNVVTDLIPGMAIELSKVSTTPVTISVTQDITAAQSAITALVTAYNDFETVLKEQTSALNSSGEVGALKSDSAIRGIRDTMRRLMSDDSSSPGTTATSLSSIGIAVQRSGKFAVDSGALALAIQSNYSEIVQMFSANTNSESPYGEKSRGIAGDLVVQINDYLSSSGIITTREATYTATQSKLEDDQTVLDAKMEKVTARYTSQFSTMNRIMDEMKSMQTYLESQLDNLPYTSDNN
jgi:flagellar hook-associated protein 2